VAPGRDRSAFGRLRGVTPIPCSERKNREIEDFEVREGSSLFQKIAVFWVKPTDSAREITGNLIAHIREGCLDKQGVRPLYVPAAVARRLTTSAPAGAADEGNAGTHVPAFLHLSIDTVLRRSSETTTRCGQ